MVGCLAARWAPTAVDGSVVGAASAGSRHKHLCPIKEGYFGTQGILTLTQQLEEVLRFQPGSSVPLSRLAHWPRWGGR